MNLSKYYFVDLETGGLDPDKSDIVSICIIRDGVVWSSKVKPRLPVSKQAAAVNGYNKKEWEDAPYFEELLPQLEGMITKDRYLVAHNAKFEYEFLGKTSARAGIELNLDYHVFCTAQLAMEHLPLTKVSLNIVAEFLDIPLNYHNVISDTEACKEVFKCLYRCTWIKRWFYYILHLAEEVSCESILSK